MSSHIHKTIICLCAYAVAGLHMRTHWITWIELHTGLLWIVRLLCKKEYTDFIWTSNMESLLYITLIISRGQVSQLERLPKFPQKTAEKVGRDHKQSRQLLSHLSEPISAYSIFFIFLNDFPWNRADILMVLWHCHVGSYSELAY